MSQMFNLFRVSSRALLVANNSGGASLQRYAVPAIQRFSHSSASSSPYISHQFYSNDAYTSQLDRGASRAGQTATQNKDQQQDSSSSSSVHFHGSDQQSQASTKPLGASLSGSNPGMQGQYNKDEVFSKIRGAETDDLSASSDKNKKDFSSSSSSSSSKNRQSQTRQFNEDDNKDKDKDEKEDYDSDDDDRVKDADKRRTHQFSEFNKNQSKNDWKMQQGGDKSSSFNNKDLNNKDFNQNNNKNQQQSDEFYHSQIDAFNKEKSYGKKANYSEENPQSTKTYGSSSDRSQKYEGDRMSPSSSSSSSSSASKNYSSSDSPFTATYVGGDSSFQSDSSKDMDKSKKSSSSSSSSSSNNNRSSGDKKKDVDYYDTAQGIFQKDKEFTGNNRMDTNYGSDRMQQKQNKQQQSSSSGSSSSSFDSSDLPSGMGMTRKDMESQDPVHSAKERQQNAFHKEEDRSALKGDIGGAGGNFGSSSVVSSSVASKEAEQKKEFKKDQMDSDKDRDRDRYSKNQDKDRSDRDRDSNKDYKKQSDKKEFDQSSSQQNAGSRQQSTHDLNEQLNDATIPHSQHSRDNQWRGP